MDKDNQSRSVEVNFCVNGIDRQVSIDPRYALSDVLREDLSLTGLHVGCEQGVCGACTVLIDGEPAVSCLTLAVQADGCDIKTVESLSDPNSGLARLQRSFIKHGAFQCGYCTPGFLMMGHYILTSGHGKTRETVRDSLSGNICRCTGYEPIIDAIVAVGTDADLA